MSGTVTQFGATRYSPLQQLSTQGLLYQPLLKPSYSRYHRTSYETSTIYHYLTKLIISQQHQVRIPVSPVSKGFILHEDSAIQDTKANPDLSATSLCLPSPSAICPVNLDLLKVTLSCPCSFFVLDAVLKLCFLRCCHSLPKAAMNTQQLN